MFSTTAIILAGGRSRRMGRDKALLPMPGNECETFIEHLVALFTSLCSDVVLVARSATQATEYIRPGVRVVTDNVPNIGPLMGLYSGLSATRSSHVLLTAVDMPFMQPEMVQFLLSQPLDDSLLIPVVDDVPQVLPAVYPRTILPIIDELLQAGQRGPRSLLDVAPVRYIGEAQLRAIDPELRSFVNLNTPQEWAKFR